MQPDPNIPSPDDLNRLVALFRAGRYKELEGRAQALVEQYPGSGMAWNLLGVSLGMQGKSALPALQKAAQLLPDDAAVHSNLGKALYDSGQFDPALASQLRALAIQPGFVDAHYNLGVVLKELGRLDEAAASYRRALELKPDYAEAYNNLGVVLKKLGRLDEAVACYQRALAIKPDHALAHNNLGNVLRDLGQAAAAVARYRSALSIRPDYAEAHLNLGIALRDIGRSEEAAASFRRALDIWPNYAEAYNNLGLAMRDLNKVDDAVANYRRALKAKPGFVEAQSNLLFALNYEADRAESICLEEARTYGRMAAGMVEERFTAWTCTSAPERLRLGVVSGDLRLHPVGHALESLLASLDPARVDLVAYATFSEVDELTERIRPRFGAWRNLEGLSDGAAAQLIHDDGVHVLLDLSGHTAHNRLPVFAWKPAPVQASWLGYFATTGVAEMDYLLTSEVAVPQALQGQFTEALWYLPDIWLCFTPPAYDLAVSSLPALRNGQLTFGSFQRFNKVGDAVLSAWGKVLSAVPGARLRWQCKEMGDPAKVEQTRERLARCGIDPQRVGLHGTVATRADYLASYHEVDVILDTFPYPGVTTTCEALWMGVPTVTLAGGTLLSRQGAGVLTPAGLVDWVASSEADYVEKAIALAGDLPALARLRASLRERVLASPVFDAGRFARNFEEALWGMWRQAS